MSQRGGGSESFIGMVQTGCDQLMDTLLMGCWCGKWESASSTFCFPTSLGSTRACGHLSVNFSHLVGVSVSAEKLKDIVLCIPWGETSALPRGCTIFFFFFFGLLACRDPSSPIRNWTQTTAVRGFPESSVGKDSACNAEDTGLIPGSGRSAGEGISYPFQYSWASLVAQLVKNPPTIQETWVWSLGWEDPLENGKATQSSILAWRIPWTIYIYSPWGCKESDMTERLSLSIYLQQWEHGVLTTRPLGNSRHYWFC